MSAKNDGGPAFPIESTTEQWGDCMTHTESPNTSQLFA